jgi:hypothetical protein
VYSQAQQPRHAILDGNVGLPSSSERRRTGNECLVNQLVEPITWASAHLLAHHWAGPSHVLLHVGGHAAGLGWCGSKLCDYWRAKKLPKKGIRRVNRRSHVEVFCSRWQDFSQGVRLISNGGKVRSGSGAFHEAENRVESSVTGRDANGLENLQCSRERKCVERREQAVAVRARSGRGGEFDGSRSGGAVLTSIRRRQRHPRVNRSEKSVVVVGRSVSRARVVVGRRCKGY